MDLIKELQDERKSLSSSRSGSRSGSRAGGRARSTGGGSGGLSLPGGLDALAEVDDVVVDEEEDDDLDSNGYHSDSESCVMTSGNSPFISKEARYHFLSRSGRIQSQVLPDRPSSVASRPGS